MIQHEELVHSKSEIPQFKADGGWLLEGETVQDGIQAVKYRLAENQKLWDKKVGPYWTVFNHGWKKHYYTIKEAEYNVWIKPHLSRVPKIWNRAYLTFCRDCNDVFHEVWADSLQGYYEVVAGNCSCGNRDPEIKIYDGPYFAIFEW